MQSMAFARKESKKPIANYLYVTIKLFKGENMMRYIALVVAFLTTFLVCPPVSAQAKNASSMKYVFAEFPNDGQVHELESNNSRYRSWMIGYPGVWGFLHADGVPYERPSIELPSEDFKREFDRWSKERNDSDVLMVMFVIKDRFTNGDKSRSCMVYLGYSPKIGESKRGSVVLEYAMARPLLNHLDDMLRTGRAWRSEGVAKDDETQDFSSIDGSTIPGQPAPTLTFKVFRVKNSATIYWAIGGKSEVAITSDDLTALSRFRDTVEKGVKWLESQ